MNENVSLMSSCEAYFRIFIAPFLSNRSSKSRIDIQAITKERKKGKMEDLTVRLFILPLFCSLVIAYMSICNFDDRLLKNGAVKNSEISLMAR